MPPVRAGLAVFLAIAIAPGVHPFRNVHELDGITWAIAFVTEFLIGGALGLAASMVYDGAYAGGRAIDDYVGVKAIAPSLQLVAPSGFGRIWSLAFTGGFFLLGGYRVTVLALAKSFAWLPPGAPFDAHAWTSYAASLIGTIVAVAVAVAAPAIGLAFAVQIALGALSRAIPRFGSVTLSFPLAFAAALIVTAIAIPLLADRAFAPSIAAFPGASR